MSQPAVDTQNAAFWDTLCGWNLAQHAGITGRGEDDLRRFDELYLGFYPYLEGYVPEDFGGKKVLEVGLGYGTLGQLIASRNADYYGADIADGAGREHAPPPRRGSACPRITRVQASVLKLPFEDATFDYVYSIGCLHHTGDLERSVQEVHRVLRPGRPRRRDALQPPLAAAAALRSGADAARRACGEASTTSCAASTTPTIRARRRRTPTSSRRGEVRRLFRDFARREDRRAELRRLRLRHQARVVPR